MARKGTITQLLAGLGCTATIANGYPQSLFGRLFARFTRPKLYGAWNPLAPFDAFGAAFPATFLDRYGLDRSRVSGTTIGERRFDIDPLLQAPGDPLGLGARYSVELTATEYSDLLYVLYVHPKTGAVGSAYDVLLRPLDDALAAGLPLPKMLPCGPLPIPAQAAIQAAKARRKV